MSLTHSPRYLAHSLLVCSSPISLAYLQSRKFHDSSRCKSVPSDDLRWPSSPNPTPYEIFGLPPTASSAEIKKRYYQLARKYHPDSRISSTEVDQERLRRFRDVVRANELLSAAKSRRIYDENGFGWGDMTMNDIMGDPAHWQGNYEGRFRSTGRPGRPTSDGFEGFFDGNSQRAQPYYTSNANFAGGIIVMMVLVAVLQFSHATNSAEREIRRRTEIHERAAVNLRDARTHARRSGRGDMIDAFRQRRDVKSGVYDNEDFVNVGLATGRR